MPTYEYECLNCGERFDVFQKMSDEHLTECVKCKGKVKRLISAGSGVIFKGSGFYETDYKNQSSPDIKKCATKDSGGCSGCNCSQTD